jgi:hypothetical protein
LYSFLISPMHYYIPKQEQIISVNSFSRLLYRILKLNWKTYSTKIQIKLNIIILQNVSNVCIRHGMGCTGNFRNKHPAARSLKDDVINHDHLSDVLQMTSHASGVHDR